MNNEIKPCTKIRFKTKREAKEYMASAIKDGLEIDHVYQCMNCGMWHMTSMSKKRGKKSDKFWAKGREIIWGKYLKK